MRGHPTMHPTTTGTVAVKAIGLQHSLAKSSQKMNTSLLPHITPTCGHIVVTEYHIYDAGDDCIIVSGTFPEMEQVLDTMAGNLFIFNTQEIEQIRAHKNQK